MNLALISKKDITLPSEVINAMKPAPKLWDTVNQACVHGRRVLLWGPPGTGKSFAGTNAVNNTAPISRLYLTMDTPAAEVRGHFLPNEAGSFSWHDGPGIRAWRSGGRLVIDEIDAASGDTLTLLMGLLDDEETARLTLPTNETVMPEKGFSCVATTNQKPTIMPEALLDRFDVVAYVNWPCPAAFEPSQWHSPDLCHIAAKTLFSTENELRGDNERPIGLRAFRSVDRLLAAGVPTEAAFQMVMGEKVSSSLLDAMKVSMSQQSS